MARSTCLFFPVVQPTLTSSLGKSSITLPVLRSTFRRLKVKMNIVQSSHNVNVTKIAVKDDVDVDHFTKGRLVDESSLFRQNFCIRSYETGPDGTVSIETLVNIFQEAGINHAIGTNLDGDGLACSREMCKRNLIWVVAKTQVIVDHYPVWCDVIEVDTWTAVSGKNSVRRDWVIRDNNTGGVLARGSSKWVMMNASTRKLAKIPAEVREEMDGKGFFVKSPPVLDMGSSNKIPKLDAKTASSIHTGLTPGWNDLDLNQHVNNAKYVRWIIESVPLHILKTHKLVDITVEYRMECTLDNVLQSLTSVMDNDTTNPDFIECQHLLCLEGGVESVRGMTKWKCM